jgi:hypothetical protein
MDPFTQRLALLLALSLFAIKVDGGNGLVGDVVQDLEDLPDGRLVSCLRR